MLKEDEMVLAFIRQHPDTRLTAIAAELKLPQAIIVGSLGRLQRSGAIRYTYKKIGERNNQARPLDFEYQFQVLQPAAPGERDATWDELTGRVARPALADAERVVLRQIGRAIHGVTGDPVPTVPPSATDANLPVHAPCAICGSSAHPNLIVRHIKTKYGDYGLRRLCHACGRAVGDLDMEEYRGRLYARAMNALAEAAHILSMAPANDKALAGLANIATLQDAFDSRVIGFQCEIDAGDVKAVDHE
ncbi:MAG: hypothetical protein IPK79_00385 [Vampirovibrionales bacterium]|nr:hypothetical protein [Vampirovibrionales bacterium]